MILSMTKKELRIICRISQKTLHLWLNVIYFEELQKLGYRKNQKILMPKQVEYILGKQDISLKDLQIKPDSHAIQ